MKAIKKVTIAAAVLAATVLGASYASHQQIMKMSGAFEKIS